MPKEHLASRTALETVWLARCPANLPEFGGMYVFAAPNPPTLQRTGKKFLVWNYGFTVLPADTYHRLFKGFRLHPSEGPRRVSLKIERAASGPWVARYELNDSDLSAHYVFGHRTNPKYSKHPRGPSSWTPHHWTLSSQTFVDIFSGMCLPPDHEPVTVSITATALD